MKKIMCFFICFVIMLGSTAAYAEIEVDAKSCILMEASTGKILYEDKADEQLPIASVTKIMTMLLIMESIDSGAITLEDMVPVSENAMSYGGSTMFLEAGEQLSVNDMLKGIAVASANDGCVAMSEFLAGSESAFVDKMNTRAKELGMENTHFVNTNGLDADDHYSSARDVAIMSRELIKHKKIFDYTSIWMDELRDGKFQLANTNKLIRFYNGANGLKTGSTSKALCCLSATAMRDDMQLIGVVLGAPTSALRFSSAKALLDYGFASYKIEKPAKAGEELASIPVEKGIESEVKAGIGDDCQMLVEKGTECSFEIEPYEKLIAPVKEGDCVGKIKVMENGNQVDEKNLIALSTVEKKGIGKILSDFIKVIVNGNGDTEI